MYTRGGRKESIYQDTDREVQMMGKVHPSRGAT